MTRRKQPEFELQCAVAGHLHLRAGPNVYWTALPLGELRTKATGRRLKAMGVRAGAPDLLVLVNGRAYGLELKADSRGLQSESQRQTERAWRLAGSIYTVAHGIDEAVDCLMAWGAIVARDPVHALDIPFDGKWSR